MTPAEIMRKNIQIVDQPDEATATNPAATDPNAQQTNAQNTPVADTAPKNAIVPGANTSTAKPQPGAPTVANAQLTQPDVLKNPAMAGKIAKVM